jgi:hypothetical protein
MFPKKGTNRGSGVRHCSVYCAHAAGIYEVSGVRHCSDSYAYRLEPATPKDLMCGVVPSSAHMQPASMKDLMCSILPYSAHMQPSSLEDLVCGILSVFCAMQAAFTEDLLRHYPPHAHMQPSSREYLVWGIVLSSAHMYSRDLQYRGSGVRHCSVFCAHAAIIYRRCGVWHYSVICAQHMQPASKKDLVCGIYRGFGVRHGIVLRTCSRHLQRIWCAALFRLLRTCSRHLRRIWCAASTEDLVCGMVLFCAHAHLFYSNNLFTKNEHFYHPVHHNHFFKIENTLYSKDSKLEAIYTRFPTYKQQRAVFSPYNTHRFPALLRLFTFFSNNTII